MQDNVVKLDASPEFTVGRKSKDMCLLASSFNGFANSTRLSILLLLADKGEMRVGDLVSELHAPQPRVSDHLRCLAQCGYVQARRDGRRAYYSITDDRVLEMLHLGESLLRDNLAHIEACGEIEETS